MSRLQHLLPIFIILLLSSILCVIIRLANLSLLHDDVFDPDSARYLRQAKLIAEQGKLPEVDHMRWHPIGVKSSQRLTLFPHILAGLFKLLSWSSPTLTIEGIAILFPIIFSILSAGMLYLLINRLTDTYTALLSVNIAVISWPWVARTTAGYADRDVLVLFWTITSYYFYVRSFQTANLRKQLQFSFASGLFMALLGLTWEGVGLLIGVIVFFELTQFITTSFDKQVFFRYFCWIAPVWCGLLFFKENYWQLSRPASLLALGPSTLLFLFMGASLITIYYSYLIQKLSFKNRYPLKILLIFLGAIVVILGAMVLNIVYTQSIGHVLKDFWYNLLAPFGKTRLSVVIDELQKQGTVGWIAWPGAFFFFTSAGIFLLARRLAENLQLNVWLSVVLFELALAGTVLTRVLSGYLSGKDTILTDTIYIASITIFLLGMGGNYLFSHHKRNRKEKKKLSNQVQADLFLLVWFFLMLFCARGSVRFEFFLVPVFIAVGSYALVVCFQRLAGEPIVHSWMYIFFSIVIVWEFFGVVLSSRTDGSFTKFPITNYQLSLIIIVGLTLLLVGIGVFRIFKHIPGKRIQRSILLPILTICSVLIVGSPFPLYRGYASTSYALAQSPSFLDDSTRKAFRWMNDNLPSDAVIAASWEYGSFLNLHANRATIIDEEQILYWVYLMNRHLMLGQTEREALEFLKTHNATHILLTQRDISLLSIRSELGSDETFDRRCDLHRFGEHVESILVRPSGESCYRYLIPRFKPNFHESLQLEGQTYPPEVCKVSSVYLQVERQHQRFPTLKAALVELDVEGKVFRLSPEEIFLRGNGFIKKDLRFLVHY